MLCIVKCDPSGHENVSLRDGLKNCEAGNGAASKYRNCPGHCEPVTSENPTLTQPTSCNQNRIAFKISLSRPSPMGKVAALVLTEEDKRNVPCRLSWFPSPTIFSAIPLPPTIVGTFPSGKVFGCPKRRTNYRAHP